MSDKGAAMSGQMFRLSLLDAAADYIDVRNFAAASRSLRTLLGRGDDEQAQRWIHLIESARNAERVVGEIRAEVSRLRTS